MKEASGNPASAYRFRTAPIGAGGFVIGLDISADGRRMVHWADVFNGYIREAGEPSWKLLLRPDNLDRSEYDPKPKTVTDNRGVFAARIAPSNRDIIYASWNGFVFRTTDGAKSWRRTALPPKVMQSNMGPQRRFNRTIDVHPADPAQVIVGTNNNGVHFSLDGGASWAEVANLPPAAKTYKGSAGKYLVAFDPGQPGIVYVHVFGSGLYRSTQGLGGAFLPVPESPAEASNLVVTSAGDVWLCRFRTGRGSPKPSLFRMTRGGAWTAFDPGIGADQVAVDPFDARHIVVADENGGFRQSFDGGASWRGPYTRSHGAGEIAWLSNRPRGVYPSQILFDPVERNRLWMTEGLGVSWSNPPSPGVKEWVWHDYSKGNEELCATSVLSGPNNPVPLLTFWDKPIWRLDSDSEWTNRWSYPVPAGEAFKSGTVTVAHGLDYAIDDPDFLAACAGQFGNYNGYSEDYGRTWHKFPGLPPGGAWKPGGCIAVSNRNNIIVAMANNGPAVYTLDGGMTWRNVAFGGYDPVTHWNNAYYTIRRNIASDKTRPGVFAALVNNVGIVGKNVIGRDIAGIWLTTDGGATWTRKYAGIVNAGTMNNVSRSQFDKARLEYVPGRTGELLYADGRHDFKGDKLLWSRDDGASWADVNPDVRTVTSFGFGKAAPGQARPAVFFRGTVKGVSGVYASYDWFATTPVLLSRFPNGSIDNISFVGGDLHRFGRCYVGFSGNGAAIGDLA